MGRVIITVSIDSEIKESAYKIFKDKNIKISHFVEKSFLDLIKEENLKKNKL